MPYTYYYHDAKLTMYDKDMNFSLSHNMAQNFFPPDLLDTGDFMFNQLMHEVKPMTCDVKCGCFGSYIAMKRFANGHHYENGRAWFNNRCDQYGIIEHRAYMVLSHLVFRGASPLSGFNEKDLKRSWPEPYEIGDPIPMARPFGTTEWVHEPAAVMQWFNAWVEHAVTFTIGLESFGP